MPEISDQDTSFITAETPLETVPVASLFFSHGEMAGQEIPLIRDRFYIGRSKNNNLSLSDKSVSRKHAVIDLLDDKYVISDLGSLKGTYLNGKKIDEAVLQPGDVINIGENRMQFRLMTPSGRWAAHGRKNRFWYIIVVLLLGILIGGASWFFVQKYYSEQIPRDIMTRIEIHYERGVEFFNKEHDVTRAREEWNKILELDPQMKTDFAIKASILLKNTEEEKTAD